jgi:hypothetical protein
MVHVWCVDLKTDHLENHKTKGDSLHVSILRLNINISVKFIRETLSHTHTHTHTKPTQLKRTRYPSKKRSRYLSQAVGVDDDRAQVKAKPTESKQSLQWIPDLDKSYGSRKIPTPVRT